MDTKLRQLDINESYSMTVNPRIPYVPTGLIVETDQIYTFTAEGQWQDWRTLCGPNGWDGGCLQRFNRLPNKPFFLLCGTVGQHDNTAFAIGDGYQDDIELKWPVPSAALKQEDTQLYLFANDWRLMYFNNHELDATQGGPLRVTIHRIQ